MNAVLIRHFLNRVQYEVWRQPCRPTPCLGAGPIRKAWADFMFYYCLSCRVTLAAHPVPDCNPTGLSEYHSADITTSPRRRAGLPSGRYARPPASLIRHGGPCSARIQTFGHLAVSHVTFLNSWLSIDAPLAIWRRSSRAKHLPGTFAV